MLLHEYCLAPVSVARNRIIDRSVIPTSYTPDLCFASRQLDAIFRKGGVWILIRIDPERAERVVDELRRDVKNGGSKIQFEWFNLGPSGVQLIRGEMQQSKSN